MPQLDFSTYISQIFWLLIVFCWIYFILAKKYLPRISNVIQERINRIDANLADAKNLSLERKQIEEKLDELLKKAREEARYSIVSSTLQVKKNREGKIAELEAKIAEDYSAEVSKFHKKTMVQVNSDIKDAIPNIINELEKKFL